MAERQPGPPATPAWRGSGKRGGVVHKKTSKGRRVFTLTAVMLALAGAIAAWVFLIRPQHQAYFVPAAFSEYQRPQLPVNGYADQDRRALSGFFKAVSTYTVQEGDLLRTEIGNLRRRSPDEPVIVYVSGYVLADRKGDLYLLPANAAIDEHDQWYPFREFLQDLKGCPSKQKLLLLDVMRPVADPRLGVLVNDAADRVQDAVAKVDDPGRVVISACSPGQVSLTSEDLRQSVFTFYLVEGLRGAAAGYASARTGNTVSVRDLYQYVKEHVDRWARQNRGQHQVPAIAGDGNFEVVRLSDAAGTPPGETDAEQEPARYPEWLYKEWERRDRWWKDEVYRQAPREFRRLEAVLLRAEQRWRGGVDVERVRKEMNGEVEDLQRPVDRLPTPGQAGEPLSVAAAALVQARDDAAAAASAAANAQAAKPADAGDGKPADGAAAKEAGKPGPAKPVNRAAAVAAIQKDVLARLIAPTARPKDEDLDKVKNEQLKSKDPLDVARAILEAVADEPTAERVHRLYYLWPEAQTQRVEAVFLHQLDQLADKLKGRPWPQDAVRAGLRAVLDGERVMTFDALELGRGEPRVFAWTRDLLQTAADRRHEGAVHLFHPGFGSADEARRLFGEASTSYATARKRMELLQAAYRVGDEAQALLPGLAVYLGARAEHYEGRMERELASWRDAVQALKDLQAVLDNPPGPEETVSADRLDRVGANTGVVQRALALLTRAGMDTRTKEARVPFHAEAETVVHQAKRPEARTDEYWQVETLLQACCLSAADRKQLYEAGQALARRLNDETRRLDRTEQEQNRHPTEVADFNAREEHAREATRAALRARLAIDLLGLGGYSGTPKLAATLQKARPGQDRPEFWQDLADDLRQAFADRLHGLPAEVQVELKRNNLALVDRLSRAANPFDALELGRSMANPTAELRHRQALAFASWLDDQYTYEKQDLEGLGKQDLKAPGADTVTQEFYKQALQQLEQFGAEASHVVTCTIRPGEGKPETVTFGDGVSEVPYVLQVTLDGPDAGRVTPGFRVLPGINQVTADAPATLSRDGDGPFEAHLTVRLLRTGESESGPPQARGLLVAAEVKGRSFHYLVPTGLPLPPDQRLRLLVSDTPADPVDSLTSFALRPRDKRQLYVFAHNPTPQARKVRVVLRAPGHPGTPFESAPIDLPAQGKPVRITFPLKGQADKPGALPELQGGELTLRLLDAAKGDDLVQQQTVRVTIDPPSRYVRVSNAVFDPGANKLSVKLKTLRPLQGEDCPVQLVLPDFVTSEDKVAEGVLPAAGGEVELFAKKLRVSNDATEDSGTFFLNVDGYERAFLFNVTFSSRGGPVSPTPVLNPPVLHVTSANVARAGDQIHAHISVDNGARAMTIKVYLETDTDSGMFVEQQSRQGDRNYHLGFSPSGPEGSLLLESDVRDWDVSIPVRGQVGRRKLRVRLFDEARKEVAVQDAVVILDNTPPERVRFVTVAAGDQVVDVSGQDEVKLTGTPPVSLRVTAEGRDKESDIKKVFFYWGTPDKEPPAAQMIEARHDAGDRWVARVPMDKRGPLDLTVKVVNGVDLPTARTVSVELLEPKKETDAGKKPAKTGTVAVTVLQGDRAQPGKPVSLLGPGKDAKEPVTKDTDENGQVTFEDVAPGTYKVSAFKKDDQTSGEKTITVEAGKTVKVEITLLKGGGK
jgi:hypothetical protein